MALRREPAGRDLGLTARMAAALVVVAVIYLAAAALLVLLFVAGGRPQDLAAALLALDGLRPPTTDLRGRAVQALCIVPTRRRRFEVLADHPPVEKRVRRLESLSRSLGKVAA